jgi:hypothetical protein
LLCNLLDTNAKRGAYFQLTFRFHASKPFPSAKSLSLSSISDLKTILEAPVEEPAKEEIVVKQKEKDIESESK